ncbi:MAG TPA: hypothetical protein VMV82_03320, partial [Candidatus Dormibacteraeota bacterium]|nr:hypothetical protein [Candidatus Dormibacteraeota bacterium]
MRDAFAATSVKMALAPLLALAVACSSNAPAPGNLRFIDVELTGKCCGQNSVIALSPDNTFRFMNASTGESVSGSLNYA